MMAALGNKDTDPPMYALLWLISTVIQLYIYVLVASAILSWLIAFNVVNTRNQAVAMIADVLYRLTEPALAPIRRVLPNFGGLDISPVVVILLLVFVQKLLFEYA
jgi:YggT family protein